MNRKIIVFIASQFLLFSFLNAQNFIHDFDAAQERSIKDSKNILMIFSGSDWCKPCIQLRENIITTPSFTKYAAEHLVLLEVDFPYKKKNRLSKAQRQHNERLADSYNPDAIFPMMLLIDEKGIVLHKMGFDPRLTVEEYISIIEEVLPSY